MTIGVGFSFGFAVEPGSATPVEMLDDRPVLVSGDRRSADGTPRRRLGR